MNEKTTIVSSIIIALIVSQVVAVAFFDRIFNTLDKVIDSNSHVVEQIEELAMRPVSSTYNVDKMIIVDNGQSNKEETVSTPSVSEPMIQKEAELYLDKEDKELIALITMAEAEGESEYGQRLVIDTILNRLDSSVFPDTVHDVIYSPNQFACVWNGRANRCWVKPELYSLVEEECDTRTNHEVMYFRSGHFGSGEPLFVEGAHYFSKQKGD